MVEIKLNQENERESTLNEPILITLVQLIKKIFFKNIKLLI